MTSIKMLSALTLFSAILSTLTINTVHAQWSEEWSKRGNISVEFQGFTDTALHTADQSTNLSLAGTAEFYRTIGENGSITISPLARLDENDSERTHFDFNEFLYSHSGDTWEVNVGLGKVFWGVAESVNIVDVINQRDTVEGIGPEHKLGQPMINLLLLRDWGEISLFVLPGFRERTFAGQNGRPRGFFAVDTDNALFETGDEKNIDAAARVSGAYNEWDLGFHVFHGTDREPALSFPSFVPFYNQITQVGVDVQATLESWLLKNEWVYKSGDNITDHMQLVTGLEYSFYDVAESGIDVGVISEWLFDDREQEATTAFQNDLLVGLRFALNDEQSSELLMGVIADLDGGATTLSAEASRRIGDSFKLSLEALVWIDAQDDPILSQFEQEDFVQLELGYFF